MLVSHGAVREDSAIFQIDYSPLNIKYMKRIDYRGRTISQVEDGFFKGKYIVEYGGFCLVCEKLASAKMVVDAKLRRS